MIKSSHGKGVLSVIIVGGGVSTGGCATEAGILTGVSKPNSKKGKDRRKPTIAKIILKIRITIPVIISMRYPKTDSKPNE